MTQPSATESLTYADAGVDIAAGNALVERIKPLVARTRRPGVLGGIGGFGGLFELPEGQYRQPVMVSGADGVGTKLKLAIDTGIHDTIGIDLVAMCVNDILVCGAEPLWFLDYFASGKLDVEQATSVVAGIAEGCVQAGAALLGGETAEMPGLYQPGDYDLAGFAVGVVEKSAMIDGNTVTDGDVLVGIASSGPHSNGYSLINRLLERTPQDEALVQQLLSPTRIYVQSVRTVLSRHPVKAMAHITGGGLTENLPRVLPAGCIAEVDTRAWQRPTVFDWIQRTGNVADDEMLRTFNCGIGFVLVVAASEADAVVATLGELSESACRIGTIARIADAPIADTQVADTPVADAGATGEASRRAYDDEPASAAVRYRT